MAKRQNFQAILGAVSEMRNAPAPVEPEPVTDWESIAARWINAVSGIKLPEFREADMSPVANAISGLDVSPIVYALSQIKPADLTAIVKAISALELSPVFEVSNTVDTAAIAKAISQIKMTVNVPPMPALPKPLPPVAYEFTVQRDNRGQMTGVTAVPKK